MENMEIVSEESAKLVPIRRLTRDLANAGALLSRAEARFFVDAYYAMQDNRIRSTNQFRALGESGEPRALLAWFSLQNEELENQVKRALDKYSAASPLGSWARGICGIGPVIAAGLLSHIDIEKCDSAGDIWSFAGLNPEAKWEKGQKRPWNAALKVVCWKMGESFVKVKGNESDIYGKIYAERKAYEAAKNERGEYAAQAAEGMARVGKSTEAYGWYAKGLLPPGHLHARAKRYAVKLFLAHYFEKGCEFAGRPVPAPYPIAHLGHTHWRRAG